MSSRGVDLGDSRTTVQPAGTPAGSWYAASVRTEKSISAAWEDFLQTGTFLATALPKSAVLAYR